MKFVLTFLIVIILAVGLMLWLALKKDDIEEDDPLQRCADIGGFGNVSSSYCNKFYMCVGQQFVPLYCSAGFAFDVTTGRCENAAVVDCQGRPFY
ncbi:ChtB2 [Olene mendosa nucleopolyhedrovirus]|uniref:ChtB2 n=1 Tax=Olene mendosa nucleopolyhedrovirus TaxID=2933796 RepID=A0AAX3AVT3_9ABAC|nr:ChtB2 [Olene mendosa nucleopolyhedrovirus]UOQ18807.1 ChtB2 [Olene mendosa nucleopolyhedrovirus]